MKSIKLAEDVISAITQLSPAIGTYIDHLDNYEEVVDEVAGVIEHYFRLENEIQN